jgi:hypothetical protein
MVWWCGGEVVVFCLILSCADDIYLHSPIQNDPICRPRRSFEARILDLVLDAMLSNVCDGGKVLIGSSSPTWGHVYFGSLG